MVFTASLLDNQHLKRVSVEIGQQVRLLCLWTRDLMDCLYLSVIRLVVTGGSLTPLLSFGRVTLTNK